MCLDWENAPRKAARALLYVFIDYVRTVHVCCVNDARSIPNVEYYATCPRHNAPTSTSATMRRDYSLFTSRDPRPPNTLSKLQQLFRVVSRPSPAPPSSLNLIKGRREDSWAAQQYRRDLTIYRWTLLERWQAWGWPGSEKSSRC